MDCFVCRMLEKKSLRWILEIRGMIGNFKLLLVKLDEFRNGLWLSGFCFSKKVLYGSEIG